MTCDSSLVSELGTSVGCRVELSRPPSARLVLVASVPNTRAARVVETQLEVPAGSSAPVRFTVQGVRNDASRADAPFCVSVVGVDGAVEYVGLLLECAVALVCTNINFPLLASVWPSSTVPLVGGNFTLLGSDYAVSARVSLPVRSAERE